MLLTGTRETIDIEQIKRENDMILMKIFGLEYEKFFPLDSEDEK